MLWTGSVFSFDEAAEDGDKVMNRRLCLYEKKIVITFIFTLVLGALTAMKLKPKTKIKLDYIIMTLLSDCTVPSPRI